MSNNKQKSDETNWADFQKKYFDALMAFKSPSSFSNNNSSFGNSFWNNAMDHWWKSMKQQSGASFENENLFEKVIEQSRNYYFMSEQFSSLIDGLSKFKNKKNNDVTGYINDKFEEIKSMFSNTPNKLGWNTFLDELNWADYQKKYFDAYEDPFEIMKNSMSGNMSGETFDFSSLFDGINPDMKKMRDKILSMPNVGHNREMQDKLQKLVKLSAIYQDYSTENQTAMAQLSLDALELMREKIIQMSEDGEEFNSMRQVYDLWVETNEQVYSDHVHSKEYSELNGKLVNSKMAFMKLSQEVNEDLLTAMNMPTTRAINELERRHYELRKKVKALESELKSLKEKAGNKNTVVAAESVLIKSQSTGSTANVVKKKAAKKKVAKKAKKKKESKVAKPVKKKAQKKSRSVKNDVIEIRF